MSRSRALGLIVILSLPALFIGLGKRALWNPVEPRYAGISAEMLDHDSWLLPTYNRRYYDQKPAFFFWLGAGSLSVSDNPDDRLFLVRLPSAVGGLLLVLGTWAVASLLFGGSHALVAALIALTCWITFWSSRFCHMDTLLAASVTWSVYLAYLASLAESRRVRVLCTVGLSATLAAGLMLKGPAALIFVGMVMGLAAMFGRERRFLARSGLVCAVPAACVLALLWLLPAWSIAGDDWAHSLLVDAGVLHIFDPTNSPKHGIFYYPGALLVLLAPWSFLFPAMIASLRRRFAGISGEPRQALKFVFAWVAAVAIVLYCGTTYRSRYLMPLITPLAILLSEYLIAEFGPAARVRPVTGLGVRLIVLLLVGMGLSFVFPETLAAVLPPAAADFFREIAEVSHGATLLGGLTAAAAIAAFVVLRQARPRRAFSLIVCSIIFSFAGWSHYGAPAIDRVRGDGDLIAVIEKSLGEQRALVAVERYARRESTEGFFYFELGRSLASVAADSESLESLRQGPPCLLLLRERDLTYIDEADLSSWEQVGNRPLGRHRVILMVNDRLQAKGEH